MKDDPTPDPRSPEECTRLLQAAAAGDPISSEDLLPLVYDDLRRLAQARLSRLGPGQTLQPTALVHEAYLRLVGSTDPGWSGRAHFFGAAAMAMRNLVADHLRRKGSRKRGGHLQRVPTDTMSAFTGEGPGDEVLAVEELLQVFEQEYPRPARVVSLQFFGGLQHTEIAEVLGLSTRSVERDWSFAKAWLNGRLDGRSGGG